jgi:hypothetical protein
MAMHKEVLLPESSERDDRLPRGECVLILTSGQRRYECSELREIYPIWDDVYSELSEICPIWDDICCHCPTQRYFECSHQLCCGSIKTYPNEDYICKSMTILSTKTTNTTFTETITRRGALCQDDIWL